MNYLTSALRKLVFTCGFLALGACNTPAATPAISTNTPSSQTFNSGRYDYTISYPGGWTAREYEGEWKPDKVLNTYDPGVDMFSASGANLDRVIIGAQLVPNTMSLDIWTATNVNLIDTQLTACGDTEATEDTTLGGEAATLLTYHCTDGPYFVIWVLALHDTKGYAVAWVSRSGNEADDRARFEDFLSSFTFDQ